MIKRLKTATKTCLQCLEANEIEGFLGALERLNEIVKEGKL